MIDSTLLYLLLLLQSDHDPNPRLWDISYVYQWVLWAYNPRINSSGATFVDALIEVLCENATVGIISTQSFSSVIVFASVSWVDLFKRSHNPLACGWKADVILCFVSHISSKFVFIALTNSHPWSVMWYSLQPHLHIRSSYMNFATSLALFSFRAHISQYFDK